MSVVYPTVALGIGRFGQEVVQRLTASLDQDEPLLKVLTCDAREVGSRLGPALSPLLEAGRTRSEMSEPRLDLLAFALALQGEEQDLRVVCQQAAEVVGRQYAALFPPGRPPEQRTAALHLVIVTPPLTPAAAPHLLTRLRAVEAWAGANPPYPLLSRVWLLSTHTRSGTLTSDDATSASAAFGIALLGSGLREADVIAARLSHHRGGEGLFSFFSAASLDLPKANLRRYATERSIYDGMTTLLSRVEKEADPALASSAISPLKHEEWLAAFHSGEPARRCRHLAASLSGATSALPDRIKVGPFDEDEDIRGQYAILFRSATQDKATTHADTSSLEEVISSLDRAEAAALTQIQRGLRHVFTTTLGPRSGLHELSAVEAGLRRILAGLQDEDARERAVDESGAPSDPDPLRKELEAALTELPSRKMLWAVACTAGLALGLMTLLFLLGVTVQLQMDVGYHEDIVRRVRIGAWIASVLAAIAGSYLFARWIGAKTRSIVQEALKRRRDAVAELWQRGGGGRPGQQAEAQLRQRRLRVRRGAIVSLRRALAHLQAVRRSLLQARDQAHHRLAQLCPSPQPDASLDDLRELLGAPRPLHAPLVPPRTANWWVRSCREIADSEVWANRLLEEAWPAEGLSVDLPCADEAQLNALGRLQSRPLVERNLFGDPQGAAAAAETVQEFTARAPQALARPADPVDEHGDPAPGVRAGEMFAVAPLEARSTLQQIFAECPLRLPALWTPARQERVIFVRTWEGYTLADVARGMGAKDALASAPAAPATNG